MFSVIQPFQAVSSSQDPLRVNQSPSTEMDSWTDERKFQIKINTEKKSHKYVHSVLNYNCT